MQSSQKSTANDFPLYLFHQGKTLRHINSSVRTRSGVEEDSSTAFVSGRPTQRASP